MVCLPQVISSIFLQLPNHNLDSEVGSTFLDVLWSKICTDIFLSLKPYPAKYMKFVLTHWYTVYIAAQLYKTSTESLYWMCAALHCMEIWGGRSYWFPTPHKYILKRTNTRRIAYWFVSAFKHICRERILVCLDVNQ